MASFTPELCVPPLALAVGFLFLSDKVPPPPSPRKFGLPWRVLSSLSPARKSYRRQFLLLRCSLTTIFSSPCERISMSGGRGASFKSSGSRPPLPYGPNPYISLRPLAFQERGCIEDAFYTQRPKNGPLSNVRKFRVVRHFFPILFFPPLVSSLELRTRLHSFDGSKFLDVVQLPPPPHRNGDVNPVSSACLTSIPPFLIPLLAGSPFRGKDQRSLPVPSFP